MISIYRDGTCLVIQLVGSGPISGLNWDLQWNAGSEWAARLLVHALRGHLEEELRRVRQEAYEAGWKDAKSKRRKASCWSSSW